MLLSWGEASFLSDSQRPHGMELRGRVWPHQIADWELRGSTVLRPWPTRGPPACPAAMDDTRMWPRVRQRNARERGHTARAPTPRAPLGRPRHHERRAGAISASFAPAHRQEKETTVLRLIHFARSLTNSQIPEGLGGHREPLLHANTPWGDFPAQSLRKS